MLILNSTKDLDAEDFFPEMKRWEEKLMAHFHNSRIETRVEQDVKNKFSEIAKDHHMTASGLNRYLIIQYVSGRICLKPFELAPISSDL